VDGEVSVDAVVNQAVFALSAPTPATSTVAHETVPSKRALLGACVYCRKSQEGTNKINSSANWSKRESVVDGGEVERRF
jgi:hypothetical protein